MTRGSPRFNELGRTTVWSGSFFSVEELKLRSPAGTEFTRHVVRHPGAVGIVAVDDGQAVLVDEFRAPVGRALLQIPAGKLDVAGEEPLQCAKRELAEEIGMEAATWHHLATFAMSPGFCDETFHMFLAYGLSRVSAAPAGEEEEQIEQVRVPLSDVPEMVSDGRIADAKTIVGLLLARERWESEWG